jgi:alpha-galactosidase/6-phospho-beta-glucosidase family protein
MGPRIVVIGGGSFQWVPKLFCDLVNTRSLAEAEVVLEDIDPVPLADMVDFAQTIVERAGVAMKVRGTTNQREALEGADYVVVTISTGGFRSMAHDLEVPERHGIKQSVGDTVGPGGISRALRNIPVLVGIARDMEAVCPDAWLLNITNPMTTLCRAVTRETDIATVGLCHEVTMAQFTLSQLLDADFRDFELTVTGVNHLPVVTDIEIAGEDGFARLRELLADAERRGEEPVHMPAGLGHEQHSFGGEWRKRDVMFANQVKFALFERFGVLPAAGDRHLVEFFPGFLTEASDWGARWGVGLTSIADREAWQDYYKAELAQLREAPEVPKTPSGEIVAPLIDAFLRDKTRHFPLNLPNTGQCPDMPNGPVVEAMVTASGSGLRGRDTATAPPVLAEWLRRIVSSQEATVEAALTGNRDKVVEAMLLDPLAGRTDFDHLEQMTDELLDATKPWLPQFA